ncbi:MAG: hypothetical protein KDE50_11540 [Caldilineaceae bacterium]|nr:hypothetical protein [Caldilineaceae bacterium]MCB0140531.1 hypothetical protein [Caldilineaceae bacterium]
MSYRLPSIVSTIYLVLVLLSMIPIFTGGDALSGVFAVMLTQPWVSLFDNLFGLSGNMATGLILVIIGALINAAIIYYVLRWLVNRVA